MKRKLRRCLSSVLLLVLCIWLLAGCDYMGMDEYLAVLDEPKTTAENEGKADQDLKDLITGQILMEDEDVQDTVPEEAQAVSEGCYAYEQLSQEEKAVYDQVLYTINEHAQKTALLTTDPAVLEKVYHSVCADHGGIFWIMGYEYTQYTKGTTVIGMDFTPKYTMSKEERQAMQEAIDTAAAAYLGGVSSEASDYEKAKFIFEQLIYNVQYQAGSENNQNIISVFIGHATVCQGYANAVQYLLTQLHIPCVVVTGTANGEAHAWNLVLLDGAYYYMDATWGNSAYLGGSEGTTKYVNYAYMAMTSENIRKTHTANTVFSLPECTATEDDYYVREGKYFTSFDAAAIGAVFEQAWNNGENAVSVKLSDVEVYQQVRTYFISEQHISEYCSGITSIYYLENTDQNVLILNFK